MGMSLRRKRSTSAVKKNDQRNWWQRTQLSLLRRIRRLQIATLAFACCLPLYKYEVMATTANRFIRNSCYYDGKAFTVGVVIETAPGIKCVCSTTASDGLPIWVNGGWS